MSSGIDVINVFKKYGEKTVLDSISFSASPGRITGFIGPNGAGKSTTLKAIAGAVTPDRGRITISGRDISSLRFPGKDIGFVLDPSAFHPGRKVSETFRIFSMLNGLASPHWPLLDEVGLSSVLSQRVGKLSLGMRQRLSLACALSGHPKHLILDEPMNGLDVEGVLWVRDVLSEHAQKGGAVLLSSHLLNELESLADNFIFLDRGKIVKQIDREDIKNNKLTRVSSRDEAGIRNALLNSGLKSRFHPEESHRKCYWEVESDAEYLCSFLFERGVVINYLDQETSSLQDIFLSLTHGEHATKREK